MKFSYSWLLQFLDTDVSAEEISQRLIEIGHEVEAIESNKADLSGIVVGKVVFAQQHPNADKLSWCVVSIDPKINQLTEDDLTDLDKLFERENIFSVVCGAPNVTTGMLGCYAKVNTIIPATAKKLKKAKIRDIESFGMLCSERELGLGQDHDGIIHLSKDAVIGELAENWLTFEEIFDVSITPNRGDCLSVYGLARDLAASGLGKLIPIKKPDFSAAKLENSPISVRINFTPEQKELSGSGYNPCANFTGRYIKGVKNQASPQWLQSYLESAGLRPIDALVDITNYLNIGLGRPLHAYDADKISGNVLCVRMGEAGEEFLALNNHTYSVTNQQVVIADMEKVLGLGGVIGGETSGCTAETTNVFLESAWFDPAITARTGRIQKCNTDARYRFERGIDPKFTLDGMDIAAQMIVDICGGEVSEAVNVGEAPTEQRSVKYHFSALKRVTGMEISTEKSLKILENLGFTILSRGSDTNDENPLRAGDWIEFSIPSWRWDISCEEDIVEELVRMVGLDSLEETPISSSSLTISSSLSKQEYAGHKIRDVWVARGLSEVVTYSFVDEKDAAQFSEINSQMVLSNPIASNLSVLRPNLLCGLLTSLHSNYNRGVENLSIFEVGNIYAQELKDQQKLTACAVRFGNSSIDGDEENWRDSVRRVDAYDARGDFWALLQAFNVEERKLQIDREVPEYFHPGCSGRVINGFGKKANVLGYFGQLHPLLCLNFGIEVPVVAVELDIEVIANCELARLPKVMTTLLPVKRDYSFIIDADRPVSDLVQAVQRSGVSGLGSITIFDVWSGGGLTDEGRKAIGLKVTIQPQEKNLTDADLRKIQEQIQNAGAKVGAVFRD